ncbi:hypothetical protein [Thermococcus peptonophilus]|uniref:hypothetical protein n=1 Tax=Thermococcus peptonophilus TaxID=53952 RepID=UPI0006D1E1A3
MPKLMKISMNADGNLTKELEELKTLRDELRQAMKSGDHEKVVDLLREIHKKLLEIKKMLMRKKVRDLPWRPPITPNPPVIGHRLRPTPPAEGTAKPTALRGRKDYNPFLLPFSGGMKL